MNLKSTPEALAHLCDKKNADVLKKHGVFTDIELKSRYEIYNENYVKIINIEALTMIDMVKKMYLPTASRYAKELADAIVSKDSIGGSVDQSFEMDLVKKVSALTGSIYAKLKTLESAVASAPAGEAGEISTYYRNVVFTAMCELRANVDELEGYVPGDEWPVPSYGELLYSVK